MSSCACRRPCWPRRTPPSDRQIRTGPGPRVGEAAVDLGHGAVAHVVRGHAKIAGVTDLVRGECSRREGQGERIAMTAQAAVRMEPGVTGSFPAARRELTFASASGRSFLKACAPAGRSAMRLEDRRLGVRAEHALERLDDLALAGSARGRSRAAAPSGCGRPPRPRAARRARSRPRRASRRARTAWTRPICLRSSSGGIRRISSVRLVLVLVAVDADDHALAALDLLLVAEGRRRRSRAAGSSA